ncbi:lipoyl(octanoyl) transferase LipB [Catalinimonas alkaloidigena]|nr:lipoyl(octanoyl) transferase LipB [Catalinimonas alkaloidigena]
MRSEKATHFQHWGLIDYQEAWSRQEAVFAEVVAQKVHNRGLAEADRQATRNYLIFCEHHHVYTLGRNGVATHLLLDEAGLRTKGATFYKINRGGDITYHGPGQIVGYPILDLDNFFTDIHLYLRYLEEAVIQTLADYGLAAGRIPGLTGVWLDHEQQRNPRKICAIGVRTSRWVTMHGFAFNVNTDLDYFKHIVPCGIDDKAVTSLATEIGCTVSIPEVEAKLRAHLAELFQMQLVDEVSSIQ